ncbi:MAG: alanyl-tRNA editing protein, partial [Burkholderiales bacterium]|nr:alanyl-tRNA editing protein [Anaerolineae bacterium]
MSTQLLYQTDSYLREFTARVVAVDAEQGGVVLDRTAFYPGGGGQPNDTGKLYVGDRAYTVSKVIKGPLHIIADSDLPQV